VRFLLDTHVWIWCQARPGRLNRKTRRLIENNQSDIWLSPVSVWEFADLTQKGKLGSIRDPFPWIEDALRKLPVRDASLTRSIALEAGRFQMSHGDPSDYLIVATARVLDLTLVTADQAIIESKAARLIDAA
jgi:PIN domain nuclease of toxin-antitoxin system